MQRNAELIFCLSEESGFINFIFSECLIFIQELIRTPNFAFEGKKSRTKTGHKEKIKDKERSQGENKVFNMLLNPVFIQGWQAD